jgi:hypothetical protein
MKAIIYFFLFVAFLICTTVCFFKIGGYYYFVEDSKGFFWLFVATLLSLGGSIIIGYLFKDSVVRFKLGKLKK